MLSSRLQVGDIVDHQQGAVAAFGRIAEHGAVDVQVARLAAVAEHDLAFGRLLRGNHAGHELVEIDAADDLRQRAAFGPARLDPQQAGRGVVHAEEALVGVDGQDAFHHARENGVALIPLPHDRGQLVFQVGGHLVERLGQAAHLLRIGGRKAVREVAAGEPFGIVAELFQRLDRAAGDDQAGGGQQRSQQETGREDVAENLPQRAVDRQQRNGRPHDTERLTLVADADGHVAHRLVHRLAVAQGNAHVLALVQDLLDLGPLGVVVHFLRRLLRVTHDLAVRQDDREPGGTAIAEILAEGVDPGILPGRQERNDLVFGQAGPGFEVLGRAGEVEAAERERGVDRHRRQRQQRDQERGRVKLPEKAWSVHASLGSLSFAGMEPCRLESRL